MKHFLLILFTPLLATQTMAVSVAKLAQRKKWAQAGVFKEEGELMRRIQTAQSPPDPDYFQKFRAELSKLAQEEHTLAKSRGIIKNSLIKLPVDTFGFFVATGAVNFISMWENAGGNPLAFQEQVLNLKDPVASLSFYSFMVANGFYINFRQEKLSPKLAPEMKALVMRRLSYQAMAAGSLASSVIGDIGISIKSCAALLLSPSNDPETIKKMDAMCGEANHIWTAHNMTQKYIPQIFSLLVVQAGTEVVQGAVNTTISATAQGLFKTLVAAGEKTGFEMLFVRLALSATPSKLAIQSIALIGKITQFTFFVGVDHLLNNTLTRGFNNAFKPLVFKYSDQFGLDKYFEMGGKYAWNLDRITKSKKLFDITARKDKNSVEGEYSFDQFKTAFPQEIRNFTTQLQDWRTHLNSNAETELNSWMSMTTRIINQIQLSEDFYKSYIKNLYTTSSFLYRMTLPEENSRRIERFPRTNQTGYPYRPLPLFGVTFKPWEGSNITEDKAYITSPTLTENEQSKHLVSSAGEILCLAEFYKLNMRPESQALADRTLEALKSGVPAQQGLALEKFVKEYEKSLVNNNVEFRRFGKLLLQRIGNPQPKLNAGEAFSAAYQLENKAQFESADFDLVDMKLKINLSDAGQYLTHAMVCGGKKGQIKDYTSLSGEIKWWEPDFLPPAVVNQTGQEFCAATGKGVSGTDFYTRTLTNPVTNEVSKNVTSYLTKNLKSNLLGDYRRENAEGDFETWWRENALAELPSVLEKWDEGYAKTVNLAMANIFDQKSFFTWGVDRLTQFNWFNENLLSSNLVDSFRFEKEFYLQTIHIVLTKMKYNLPAHTESILNEAKKVVIGQPSAILSPLTKSEYVDISNALENMIAELAKPVTQLKHEDQLKPDSDLKTSDLNYKKYVALKQKYEDAISKLEASVGLRGTKLFPAVPGQDSKTPVYEEIKIENPSFEQAVVQSASAGLRNIEENISKYVRMKVLMRRGLSFTKEELLDKHNKEVKKNCIHSTGSGC
ncbi:MAG: hypothetical protein H7235_02540 [Bdellovibrionaceae bacterium]|nr:hypothetical protein [Pseudobdellovibrionaceae bacterium]